MFGGIFVPNPVLTASQPIDASGSRTLEIPVQASVTGNVFFQTWVLDPGGPQGLSATNGLQASIF